MPAHCELSFKQRSLVQQGYTAYSPAQLKQLDWGLRFTPFVCSALTVVGLIYQLPYLLFGVAALGVWAFFAPAAHPMDLIYNHAVRPLFGAERLPPNPLQRRLACLAAGVMNSAAALLFLAGLPAAALVVGVALLALQAIVITTHFCTLSWIYEGVMRGLGRWRVPIESTEAQELLAGGALVIDVRSAPEFHRDHLTGALNIPLEEIGDHEALIRGQPCLLYCATGARSQIAVATLENQGLSAVHDLGSLRRAKQLLA